MQNAGYNIIESVTVGGKSIVIGEDPAAPSPYVTWRYDPEQGTFYWGHYFNDPMAAYADFGRRITEIAEGGDTE